MLASVPGETEDLPAGAFVEKPNRARGTESHLPAVAAQLLRTEKINLLYDQLCLGIVVGPTT